MTNYDPEPRTVHTRIETREQTPLPTSRPVATYDYDPRANFSVPADVTVVIWLNDARARTDSMAETLELVIDAWIERYCTQLCGGWDSEAADHLHHSVIEQSHLEQTFRAAAITHLGTADVDVADRDQELVDAFLAEVAAQVGDISLATSTVIAVRETIAETRTEGFKKETRDTFDEFLED